MKSHQVEVREGQRFEFGRNWSRFLSVLDEDRIRVAEESLQHMLGQEHLFDKTFLDIGSGSGLFSLAARRLGATVHSIDYDPQSIACGRELKKRYFQDDPLWTLQEGSVLDDALIRGLGTYDIVYSWGVLHHTGAIWTALGNACLPVADQGQLFISIYNDQGTKSKLWAKLKQTYCSGSVGRCVATFVGGSVILLTNLKEDLVRLRNPLRRYREYRQRRGMSAWHDIFDWLGGYPFEVARPEEIFEFCYERGFHLTKLRTDGGGSGTNQFVFSRTRSSTPSATREGVNRPR